jgi:hypothetical protein
MLAGFIYYIFNKIYKKMRERRAGGKGLPSPGGEGNQSDYFGRSF